MFQKTDYLTEDEKSIREEVFIKEQGFQNEFDETDHHASHLVFYDNNIPIGTCRYYKEDEEGIYHIGRLAVIKPYRGKHLGNTIIETAERMIRLEGGKKILLSAQLQAKPFYEKNGYIPEGNLYYDEHCEHILMKKMLE